MTVNVNQGPYSHYQVSTVLCGIAAEDLIEE